MQICLQLWADQRKGKHKGSVGIVTLLQARAPDLSAADSDLVVSSGFALLSRRRGAGKRFWEGGDSRNGTDRGFPLGRAGGCGTDGRYGLGKEERTLLAPWVGRTWSLNLFLLNFWALLAIAMRLRVDFARVE